MVNGHPDHPATGNAIGGAVGLTPGGSCTGDCNLVSANGDSGIVSGSGTDDLEILGNHVGSDLTGTAALGNLERGINLVGSSGGTVGSPAAPNLVSDNGLAGILVQNGATGNTIQSNRIGTDIAGTTAMGNGGPGV